MNQHYFDVPFAFSGDKTAIPDPLQVGGTVSFTEGWNYNYQRNLSTDPAALPIDRSTTNWLFNQITIALQALQQQGVPEWITSAQNGGVAYSYGKGAVVLWSASGNAPFNKYVNLNAGNTNTPSAGDPQGLTTGWQIEVDPIATAAMATAGTDDASIMTPLKVAQQVALRALLAGSGSQVFNVATATAATHATPLAQMQAAIALSAGLIGESRNLSMNVGSVASATATWTADEVITGTALGGTKYIVPNINKTLNIANTGINGMDTGPSPISTFIAVYLIYNPITTAYGLLATLEGSGRAPFVYSGANPVAGYTASALISVLGTDATGKILPALQGGRRIKTPLTTALTTSTQQAALTSLTLTAVPYSARRVSGALQSLTNAVATAMHFLVSAASYNCGQSDVSVTNTWPVNSDGYSMPFDDLELNTARTLWYIATASGGATPTYTMSTTGYEI